MLDTQLFIHLSERNYIAYTLQSKITITIKPDNKFIEVYELLTGGYKIAFDDQPGWGQVNLG